MAGTLALVGSGEFPDVMRPIDAGLLARVRQTGRAHVAALGVSVDVILIGAGARADDPQVAQRIAAASLVYVSGASPAGENNSLRWPLRCAAGSFVDFGEPQLQTPVS